MSTFVIGGLMAFFILTSASGHAEAPSFPSYSVNMTGYNAVPAQTDGDPSTTASGAYSNPATMAARSRDLAKQLPYGTVIAVEPAASNPDSCGIKTVGPTIGYRIIGDNMNARIVNTVDILFDTEDTLTIRGKEVNAARVLGSCKDVTIRVVGKIDMSHPSRIPQTQAALAASVGAAGLGLK